MAAFSAALKKTRSAAVEPKILFVAESMIAEKRALTGRRESGYLELRAECYSMEWSY